LKAAEYGRPQRAAKLPTHELQGGDQRGHLLRNLVLFCRLLRDLDLDVTPPQIVGLCTSLNHIDIARRQDFKNAGRSLLVNRPEHLAVYDRAFDLFWQAREDALVPHLSLGRPEPGDDSPEEEGAILDERLGNGLSPELAPAGTEGDRSLAYSAQEVLRHKDFAELTPEELVEVRRLMLNMGWQLEKRRTRRRVRAQRGTALDMRRTLRLNLRHGGEPLDLAWQQPKLKRRPLVILCDVSGSMDAYSRTLLKFVYVVRNSLDRVEAFVFGTRLTRITRQLEGGNVDRTLDQVAERVHDWGGGTRLGDALKTFNFDWGRRVLGRGAIVLIVSDGLDRGDIELLDREMDRLRLNCQRLIWLNPLLGSTGYQPLARGMKTALPYLDDFMPVHNFDSLEQLGQLFARLGAH
jgi:uncharacterized protein with von Willebrand factor type A (vWA) domain